MKIDVTGHLTLGAKRTLKAFRTAMFDALSEKEFDKITVNDICKKSEYPRATFYNYFDDKLDLLRYLWFYIGNDILNSISFDNNENILVKIFNSLINFFHSNQILLKNIKKNNGINSHLWHNTSNYLKQEIVTMVNKHYQSSNTNIPSDLLSKFYSDLIIDILEWYLFDHPEVDIKTADAYLLALTNNNNL